MGFALLENPRNSCQSLLDYGLLGLSVLGYQTAPMSKLPVRSDNQLRTAKQYHPAMPATHSESENKRKRATLCSEAIVRTKRDEKTRRVVLCKHPHNELFSYLALRTIASQCRAACFRQFSERNPAVAFRCCQAGTGIRLP